MWPSATFVYVRLLDLPPTCVTQVVIIERVGSMSRILETVIESGGVRTGYHTFTWRSMSFVILKGHIKGRG